MSVWDTLRSWLRPPEFPGEDEKNNQASLLNLTTWGLAFIILLSLLFIPFEGINYMSIGSIIFFGVMVAFLRWLMFQGRVQAASIFLIVSVWIMVTTLVFFSGGIYSYLVLAYPALTIMAGMLISGRAGIISALASSAVALVVMIMGNEGLLPALTFENTPLNNWSTLSTMLIILSALQAMSTRQLKNLLAKARRSADAEAERARQLQELTENLEARVAERTRSAEQARLEAELAHASAEQQMWLTSGQVNLDETLRGEFTVDSLARNGLRMLCSYLNIPAAVFFLLDGSVLRLAGGYAIDKRVPEVIRLGEGLVGQAAVDRQPIAIETGPGLSIKVRSILGEATPRHMLLQPILNGEVLVGVLELAMFEPLTELQSQFLRQVESTLAAAFLTAQARQRLNELLAETQRQAEELQAQEEELRAINEELQAQAENSNQGSRP